MPKRKIFTKRAKPKSKSNTTQIGKAKTATTMRRTNLKQFLLFPKLPLELRRMIWKLALPDGRVVEVLWSEEKKKFYTDATQPVLLQVSTMPQVSGLFCEGMSYVQQ